MILAIGYAWFVHPMACLIWIFASCHGVLLDINQNQFALWSMLDVFQFGYLIRCMTDFLPMWFWFWSNNKNRGWGGRRPTTKCQPLFFTRRTKSVGCIGLIIWFDWTSHRVERRRSIKPNDHYHWCLPSVGRISLHCSFASLIPLKFILVVF